MRVGLGLLWVGQSVGEEWETQHTARGTVLPQTPPSHEKGLPRAGNSAHAGVHIWFPTSTFNVAVTTSRVARWASGATPGAVVVTVSSKVRVVVEVRRRSDKGETIPVPVARGWGVE